MYRKCFFLNANASIYSIPHMLKTVAYEEFQNIRINTALNEKNTLWALRRCNGNIIKGNIFVVLIDRNLTMHPFQGKLYTYIMQLLIFKININSPNTDKTKKHTQFTKAKSSWNLPLKISKFKISIYKCLILIIINIQFFLFRLILTKIQNDKNYSDCW